MKKNIDYYRHEVYSHEHAKFKTLRVKYGWAGEGKFWALNNKIAQSEDCWLDLSEEYNKASIAYDLDMNMEEFDVFISYLIKSCKLLLVNGDKISTEMVQEVYNSVMVERTRCRDKRKPGSSGGRPKNDQGILEDDLGEISQSKVKESKVKESKVKESKGKESKVKHLNKEDFEIIWKEYPNSRGCKETSLNKFIKAKHPKELLPLILEAIKNQVNNPMFVGYNMPMASTWLNGKRWNDEIIEEESRVTKTY